MVNSQKFLQIFNASPTPTSIIKIDDPAFTILRVNKAYSDMTKRKAEELIGKSLFEAFPSNPNETKPTGVEKLRQSFQKVIATQQADEIPSIRYDIKLRGDAFEQEYWKVINTPVFDENGKVEFIINSATNITEQQLSEHITNLMLNNTEDSFIYIDRDLVIHGFNELFAKNYKDIFGIEVKKGNSILDYADPERHEVIKGIYDRVFEGETVERELKQETQDGDIRYFSIRYKPALDKNDTLIGSFISLLEITGEKKATLELEEKEARFRSLVEQAGDVVVILNESGKPKYITPSVEDIFGYSQEEATKLNLRDVTHPEDLETVNTAISKAFEKPGKNISVPPVRMKLKDGSWRWFETSVTDLRHEPSVQGIVDNIRDVHEQVTTKELLASSKARYQSLIQTVNGIIWEADANSFLFRYISPQSEKILGYRPDEWVGVKDFWKNKIHPDDRKDAVKYCHQKVKDGENHTFEYRMKHSKGHYIWIRDVVTVIQDNGKPSILRGLMMDITETRKAQKELRKAEEKLRNVVEHSTNMFYQHDTKGVLNYVSPQSEKFLGYSPERSNKDWTEFITDHPINKEGERITQKAIETGKVQQPYELQLETGDGRIIWVEVNEAPLKENGEVVGIVGSLTDITDRKEYEEKLQKSLERYDYASKATRDAIYDWDIVNNDLHWGEGFKTLFGHEPGEGVYPLEKYVESVHPDDSAEALRDLEFTLQDTSMSKWSYEYRFQKADGSYAHVVENGYIVRNKDGKAVRMIGAIRDISEAKKVEIQTHLQHEVTRFFKSEDRLNSILEKLLKYLAEYERFNLAEVWLVDRNQTHLNLISNVAIDKTGKEFYKYSSDIIQFKKAEGLPGKVWQNKHKEIWENINKEKRFRRINSAKKSGLKSAYGLPLFHNEILIGVLVLASDQTVDKSQNKVEAYEVLQDFLGAEIKRKQQEEEMQLLFEGSPDILAVVAPNNKFVKVNQAFCNLLGYTEEELTSSPFEKFIHPDDLKETRQEYHENISGQQQADHFLNRYITKSGEYRWISWTSSEVFGKDNYMFAYGRDITEKAQLEQLLNQAQRMARIGGWELDLRNEELYWSPITKEIHEVEPDFEPDLETSINFYKEGESRETIINAISKAKEQGSSWDVELEIITAKGNERWVRAKAEPIFLDGKCISLFGSFQDITDRKESERELEKAYQEKETILESIGDAFFALNKNWIVTYWNKEAEHILGKSKEDIIGKNLWDEYKDAKDLAFYEQYHKAVEKQVNVYFEEYYPILDKWFEVSAYPSNSGLSVYFKDITERKVAEKELKKAYKEKETILESIDDGFFTIDHNFTVTYWNLQAERLLHTPKQEILGEHLWDVFDDAIDTLSYTNYHRALHQKTTVSFEDYYEALDKWFEVNAYPSTEGISVFFKDITERKKARRQLEELNEELKKQTEELAASNAELEQFAYVASHDLQEPLRMVSSFLTQLDKKYSDQLDEKANQYIHFAVDGAQRMRQIILDLLNYSRLNQDHDNRENTDLNKTLEDVQSLERSVIKETGAKVQVESLPTLYVNSGAIKQIFQNLLSNALKYQKSGSTPKIKISAKELDTHWKFCVEDNGIGINPEFQETIFQIFQRLHTRDQYSGTGIGLAISKKIVERHGGEIWVESEEGAGSRFYFTLEKESDTENSNNDK